jgi:cell division protein FtsN
MKSMKLAVFAVIALAMIFPSCRSKKMSAVERPVQEIVQEPVTQPQPQAMAEVPARTERFTFEREEQAVAHDFFVIVGSYSNPDNAERARTILSRQGFSPIILKSETGMNRVCVNSYTSEAEARSRVHQIRTSFPEYHDAWLLIRQR